uniref:Si:dkeyp-27e10.3 n=1 Tax=Cyprinus carpio TaxID=7962 RepID=A0A8C2G747_CYPCA
IIISSSSIKNDPIFIKIAHGLPSNMSRRSLDQLPTRTHSPPALSSSSSSSSSSSPYHSERTRRPAHTPPGAKHPSSPGHHDSASSIDPTPSLGSAGSGNLGDGAQGIHLLLRPPDLLTPSQMPPLHVDRPPTPAPPTLVSPEDLYPVHSAEVDWGSGDYLETLTFMGSEGEEFSLVTSLPTHGYDPYDTDDEAMVSYNTAFPSRPILPLSSRDLQPSVTVKYGTNLRTAHPADPRLPLAPDSAQASDMNDDLDFDWAELFPIEPTEVLLPDMNSLEYYNTLQAKENASIARNRTHPHITPTHTVGPTQTPTATLGKVPDKIERTTPQPIPSVTPTPPQKPTKPPIPSTTETQQPPEGPDKGVPSIPTSHVGKTRPLVPTALPPPGTSEGPVVQAVTLKPPATKPRMTTIKTTTRTTTTTKSTTTMSPTSLSTKSPPPTTPRIPLSIAPRQYVCNITKPDMYLVRVGMPSGSSVAFAKAHVREILRREFNRSVELQVLKAPPNFIFRAVSGPLVYTAISVINAVRQSVHSTSSSSILSVTTIYAVPDYKHQVHTVLQFVPSHVDVRLCSFSERVEKGLLMAYAEVRKRSQETGNFTVHIVNITSSLPKGQRQQKAPVDITFAVRDSQGFLTGSDVSGHMRQLSAVEFSFYLGFPTLQIAEPFHYPELNVSHLLHTSWVKTVLLGVLDQRVNERTFQAKMERRLALLVGEGLGIGVSSRRWRRATSIGNNSVQIVRVSRLDGPDYPLELVYFVEAGSGERLPAQATAAMLNRLNLQRAAIVLGYRVHGVLATPVEKLALAPSETQPSNVWLIVGVVVPVLVVILIIIILYWKLCRSEKLEFQPDAMSTIQQRQKLQPPSVKGFDFAKLHLGQHSKDDIMVIQEPAPLPPPVKEATPSEGGELNTPKSKSSSTKASRAARRRGRLSPSDGDSLGSEASSGRESAEESTRPAVTPSDSKPQHRKSKHGAQPGSGVDEQLSSSSIFEHVDRLSRGSSDGTRRVSNKIQLIAMQPMPSPPSHPHNQALSPNLTDKMPDGAKVNSEIQVALRHKSEIEHHRNKIRLRAKRKGHYEFPSMEDIMAAFADSSEQQRVYQQAQEQIHKILHPEQHTPSSCGEPRKSSKGRRSPRHRQRQNLSGSGSLRDKDRLITDGDATYRKYPGVNNVAYVSDADQLPDAGSPSPTDEVFLDPGSPPSGPAPAPPTYVAQQPTIEEARQQMHSLLDDAFALVSPSSQGSSAPLTFTGVTAVTGIGVISPGQPSSPSSRPARQWDSSSYPAAPAHSPFSARYAELGMSPTSVQGLLQRQAQGSGYVVSAEMQSDPGYSSRGQYGEEMPSSSRPRPVGGSTGKGLNSNLIAHEILTFPEYSSSPLFQMSRTSLQDPITPQGHLEASSVGYIAPEERSPPPQSSASLIKAIREELQRLSQKQAAVVSYQS